MNDAIPEHVPVLCAELIERLDLSPGACVLDCTVGLGGHAALLLAAAGEGARLIGLDVDAGNLDVARTRLARGPGRFELHRANFSTFDAVLDGLGIETVDAIVADLGVSSNQIDDPRRGFSFQDDGPLDMRLDDRLTTNAADLVNRMKESELADLIYQYSQERFSRRIARRICAARRSRRITTTAHLAHVVARAMGVDPTARGSRIHPATRTFLALRAAVNAERQCLCSLLEKAPDRLARGGRIAVISFHSSEDRVVKREFLKRRAEGVYRIVTKKPITAGSAERRTNPRSRSAKLRVAERT